MRSLTPMQRRATIAVGSLLGLCLLWFIAAPAGLGLSHTPLVGSPQDLARADPAAEVWITSWAGATAPPPWGTHAKSYALHPDEYVQHVTDFYDRVFANGAPPRTP